MSGEGINIKKRYSWAQQPNGRFSIFDVEVFKFYEDPQRGRVGEEEGKEIESNFYRLKKEGVYPRLIIGHNPDGSTDNRPGAGYVDNLHFEGDTLYADFVEIPQEIFTEISDLKYPDRSVEYNPEKKRVMRVALLESQPGYFDFPLLATEKEPGRGNLPKLGISNEALLSPREYSIFMADRAIKFQSRVQIMGGKTKKFCKFCNKYASCKGAQSFECGKDEDEEEIIKMDDNMQPPATPSGVPDQPATPTPDVTPPTAAAGDVPPWARELIKSIGDIKEVLRMLIETDTEVHEGMESEGEEAEEEGAKEDKSKASSVAMQKYQSLEKRITFLEISKNTEKFQGRLKAICERAGYDFNERYQMLQKFQGDDAKRAFLDVLEADSMKPQQHVVTSLLQNNVRFSSDEITRRYQADSPQVLAVARRAFQDYSDTVNQKNRREATKFQALWPKAEDFMDYCVGKARDGFSYDEIMGS